MGRLQTRGRGAEHRDGDRDRGLPGGVAGTTQGREGGVLGLHT